MISAGLLLGIVVGLLAGGRLGNLADVRLRLLGLLFAAVALRFGTEAAIVRGLLPSDELRIALLAGAYAGLLLALWANRRYPGLAVAFVGIALNASAILLNGGRMPVWEPVLAAAGFTTADLDALHRLLPAALDEAFFLHAGPIGDVIPIPLPFYRNIVSVGDLLLTLGLAGFLAAALVGPEAGSGEPAETEGGEEEAAPGALPGVVVASVGRGAPRWRGVTPATGFITGLLVASRSERPAILGDPGTGLAHPGYLVLEALGLPTVRAGARTAIGVVRPPREERLSLGERVGAHPYLRLARNGGFSALWLGGLISLFGDRVHQVALAFLVLGLTGSPLSVALVFVAATLPNLLLGPIAGTFVDRWDHRGVLIVGDLIRAALVAVIPIAAAADPLLVYPLVFGLTSVAIFFRPARTAILPRLVREEELTSANSALLVGDTLADLVGYPLAGIFVAYLGVAALPLAFWVDGATYLASAMLLATIALPVVVRVRSGPTPGRPAGTRSGRFIAELVEGVGFLRRETVLLVNTLQGLAGQLANGALVVLTPVYAERVLAVDGYEPAAIYALLETAIGIGCLIGGIVVGLVGGRPRKGYMVALGYAGWGLAVAALGVVDALAPAIGVMVLLGIANMVYLVPSQTLFQERTPVELLGRVVGSRFSLIFGAMTLSMALGGLLGEVVGVQLVLGSLGLVAAAAGLLGILVPSVRRA